MKFWFSTVVGNNLPSPTTSLARDRPSHPITAVSPPRLSAGLHHCVWKAKQGRPGPRHAMGLAEAARMRAATGSPRAGRLPSASAPPVTRDTSPDPPGPADPSEETLTPDGPERAEELYIHQPAPPPRSQFSRSAWRAPTYPPLLGREDGGKEEGGRRGAGVHTHVHTPTSPGPALGNRQRHHPSPPRPQIPAWHCP